MKSIKYNSTVLLNYSLKGNDNLFESTFDKEPIRITIGKSEMPQIIEASLYGLKCGDEKEYSYDSKEIFGKYDQDKVITTKRDLLKHYENVKPGDIIETLQDDKSCFVTVLQLSDNEIVIDMNHPLSDKNVKFRVEIIEIDDET
jgi:FKBP-type peptidyl-prolyl cis-trans isomerase 2